MTTYGTTDAACTAVYNFLSEAVGLQPDQPGLDRHLERVLHLRHQPDLARRRRSVDPVDLRRQRQHQLRAQHDLLGPGQADADEIHRGALHLGAGRVQRPGRRRHQRRASSRQPTSRRQHHQRPQGRDEQPAAFATYTIAPLYTWSINYFPYNFNSTGDGGNAGKIFSQLYVRQAIQYLVNQPLYISKISQGLRGRYLWSGPDGAGELLRHGIREEQPVQVQPVEGQVAPRRVTGGRWSPAAPPPASSPERRRVECGAGIPAGRPDGLQPPVRQHAPPW